MLSGFFEDYLKKEPLFKDKSVLQANHTPNKILHRDDQIDQVASILAPSLRMEKPSNVFIYGKTGSGKTCVVKYVTSEIKEMANKNDLPVKIFYLNCKLKRVADTEYRLIAELAREFGDDVPATGLPTDEVYKIFLKSVEKEKILFIIILDEIDQLVHKAGDEILYNLTRLNSELKESQISIIGISNDLLFTDNLDPRVKSSLSEEEIHFHPYNALQLQKILHERAKVAYRDNVLEEGLIEKCAAYAAREHGDARRALELLRVAGELAERRSQSIVSISFLDEAEKKIEKDRVLEVVKTQPKQCKLALHAIFTLCLKNDKKPVFTGDIYEIYKDSCFKCGVRPLTQRRLSDIIAELDMLGIINAKVISKGRYGRTREIQLDIPSSTIKKIHDLLKEGLEL